MINVATADMNPTSFEYYADQKSFDKFKMIIRLEERRGDQVRNIRGYLFSALQSIYDV